MSHATAAHRIFRVRGDGNCFYRALFHSARLNGTLPGVVSCILDASDHDYGLHEDAFVESVRSAVARRMSRGHDFGVTRGLFRSLRAVLQDRQTYALMIEEFPAWFRDVYPPNARRRLTRDSFPEFRAFMAAGVGLPGNWSFEVDVGIVRRLLDRLPRGEGLRVVGSLSSIVPSREKTMYVLLHGDHYDGIVPRDP